MVSGTLRFHHPYLVLKWQSSLKKLRLNVNFKHNMKNIFYNIWRCVVIWTVLVAVVLFFFRLLYLKTWHSARHYTRYPVSAQSLQVPKRTKNFESTVTELPKFSFLCIDSFLEILELFNLSNIFMYNQLDLMY